jgi:hypothetical protein
MSLRRPGILLKGESMGELDDKMKLYLDSVKETREKILSVLLMKYGCDVEGLEIVEKKTVDGFRWYVNLKKKLVCPFCNTDDFDLAGMKHHLLSGWCKPFIDLKMMNGLYKKYPEIKLSTEGV